MNILVTGGCGFIGTALVKRLIKENHFVRVIDNLSVGKLEYLEQVCKPNVKIPYNENSGKKGDVQFINIDITNEYKAMCMCQDIQFDAIIHLAALSGVRPSVTNPRASFEMNVIGTFNMLESARQGNVPKFINASSGASIGDVPPPIHEELPSSPISPYGATKAAAEALCHSYYHSYGIDTMSLRFSNVYGPYSQHKDSLVAKFIKAAINKEDWEIYGDGNQSRDFVYIDDLVDAICKCIESKNCGGEVFQICTEIEVLLNVIVTQLMVILRLHGVMPNSVNYIDPKVGDLKTNWARNMKAIQMLKWTPKMDLVKGLQKTVEWFIDRSK